MLVSTNPALCASRNLSYRKYVVREFICLGLRKKNLSFICLVCCYNKKEQVRTHGSIFRTNHQEAPLGQGLRRISPQCPDFSDKHP